MFNHLLESSHRDDSNKWSNIGFDDDSNKWSNIEFGEEITWAESIEVNFMHNLDICSNQVIQTQQFFQELLYQVNLL